MKIFVKVKPGAREEKIVKISETNFSVAVKEPPIKGKANAAVIRVLAGYFGIAPSRLRILVGATSKLKIIEFN